MSSSTQVSTTSGPAALQTTSGDPLLTAGSANMISPSVNSATRRRLRTRNGRRLVETMSVPAAACQMAYNLGRASGVCAIHDVRTGRHVLAFDVAVHHAPRVQEAQAPQHVPQVAPGNIIVQLAAKVFYRRRQGAARHPLLEDVDAVVLVVQLGALVAHDVLVL